MRIVQSVDSIYNILVLGSPGVGKTAFIKRLIQNTFLQKYKPTTRAEEHCYKVDVDGKIQCIMVIDTPGNDDGNADLIKLADGFLILFSTEDFDSYRKVLDLVMRIQNIKDFEKFPLVVMCNKVDLPERKFDISETMRLSLECRMPFVAGSVKNNVTTRLAFKLLLDHIKKSKKEKVPHLRKTSSEGDLISIPDFAEGDEDPDCSKCCFPFF